MQKPALTLEQIMEEIVEHIRGFSVPARVPHIRPFNPANMRYVADAPEDLVRLVAGEIFYVEQANQIRRLMTDSLMTTGTVDELVHQQEHEGNVWTDIMRAIGTMYIRHAFDLYGPCIVGIAEKDGKPVVVAVDEDKITQMFNQQRTAAQIERPIQVAGKGKTVLH